MSICITFKNVVMVMYNDPQGIQPARTRNMRCLSNLQILQSCATALNRIRSHYYYTLLHFMSNTQQRNIGICILQGFISDQKCSKGDFDFFFSFRYLRND